MKTLARKTVRLALLALLFMATAGIGAYLTLTLIIRGEDAVVVPDLVGQEVLTGLEALSDLGLNTRVRATVYHDRVPKNHIIDQDPVAGTAIKRGRDVRIRVSRGPEHVVMPNLTGLTLQQARILLTENGLCQGALSRISAAGSAADQILGQSPPAGTVVTRGTCGDLLASRGAARLRLAMIDVTGLSLEAAVNRIQRLGLAVGAVYDAHRSDRPLQTVVDQQPPADYPVQAGQGIDLTVNRPNGRVSARSGSTDQPSLFRFRPETGFLKKRIRVVMQRQDLAVTLFDDFVAPSREIWLLMPKNGNPSTITVFVDDQPSTSAMSASGRSGRIP
jgi:beta-lactam-binding protein with PASTA domain